MRLSHRWRVRDHVLEQLLPHDSMHCRRGVTLMNTVGTTKFHCTIHPQMVGTLIVQER